MGFDTRASRRAALSQLEAPGSSQRSSRSSASQRSTPSTSSQPNRARTSSSKGRGRIANRQALQESESDEKSSSSDEEQTTPVRKTSKGNAAVSKRTKNLKGFVVSDDEEVKFSITVGKSQAKNPKGFDDENKIEDLVNNVLVYILSKQSQMEAFERPEIVRDVMGKKNRSKFKEVINLVQFILKETFLMKLIGLADLKAVGSSAETFLLINQVPSRILNDSAQTVVEIDKATNFLYLVLTMIYMEAAPIDTDRLWSSFVSLEMHHDLCPERANFDKFLKEEYVKKFYLIIINRTKAAKGASKSSYEWGLRAQYEFCKMTMLRDVAKKMGVHDIKTLTYAYTEAKKQMQIYGTSCRAAYVDRGGASDYSTSTDDDESSSIGYMSQNTSQDVSQLETQPLDEI